MGVAAAFDLGEVRSSSLVTRGAMGVITRVETDRGTYAVKELFVWNPGDGAEAEAELTAVARALGLTVPREVRAVTGHVLADVDGTRYRVFERLELDPSAARVPEQVGTCLATLHRSARADDRPLHPWYEHPPAEGRWAQIVRRAEDRPWAAELEQLIPHLLDLSSLRRRPQQRVTCHRDLVADNLIPLRAGPLAVLDWENAGPLEVEQELGYVLLWCPDALADYSQTLGYQPTLSPESFATGICTWLNFLAAQAQAAIAPTSDGDTRAFAERCVRAALAEPVNVLPTGS